MQALGNPLWSDQHNRGSTDFFAGNGEMAALMRANDWSGTSLGAPDTWPQSLKTVVRIMLTSRFAMWMGWGDDLTFFYNDAYRPTLGIKHAWALGAPAREVWREIWPDIGPRIDHVLATGEATWDEGLLLFLERRGFAEETYHTFSYSPLANDAGATVGMLCVVTEETDRIIGERRLACLNGLASDIAGTNSRTEVFNAVRRQLNANTRDLPFTLTYLFDAAGEATLACTTGVETGQPIAPPVINPADAAAVWPARSLLAAHAMLAVEDLEQRFDSIPMGAWDKPARQAVMAPIVRQGEDALAGFLIAAVNPYLPASDATLRFINLVAGQLGAGLANADAYAEAHRRAEALAEIDRAKTTFFSNVSHEFRTPLTLMLGPLEELLGGSARADSDAGQVLVSTAHRNALRLLRLVNSLLDFSRIEAGRSVARYEATDLASFTAEIASSFRSAVDKAGLRLVVDCPRLPQAVHVDRDMWEKIVLNLLSNAFKFTFEGEIAVAMKPSLDGKAATLTVRDTGTGIPSGELPRLFERFHRVEGARGRSFEGSGIGLALVQELAKLHGATIGVESEVGSGSTFVVTIPFGTGHLPNDRVAAVSSGAAMSNKAQAYVEEALRWLPGEDSDEADAIEPQASFDTDDLQALRAKMVAMAGSRVLLADDNSDMRAYVRRLLTEQGYEIEAVADGEAALMAARRQAPDLILSDIMMPGLDGFGLVQAVRGDPGLREIPIILLSARAGEEARVEGIEGGADDYLTKPFSARELLARVGASLKMARLRSDAARDRARSEVEFRASFEAAAVGKILIDPSSGRIVRANRAFAKMVGREPEDLAGHRCTDFIWADDVTLEAQDHDRLVSNAAETVIREMRYRRRDGSPFWVRTSAAIARVAGTNHDGIVVRAIEDIDTRYRAEAALFEAKQALEQVVQERTEALEQRDLLLREVYHRVKNNLQLVDSLLMMQARKLTDPQAKDAILSLRGRIAALGLVHQQLMGSGDLGTFDVVPFLDELSTNLTGGFGLDGVTILVDACTLNIGLDLAVPLGLIVTELVTNAIKHAFPAGTGTISINLRRDAGRNLTLIVADDGIGQADSDVVRNAQRGLGKRIVEQLVDQLEGTMTIRNDNGTTVEICFGLLDHP